MKDSRANSKAAIQSNGENHSMNKKKVISFRSDGLGARLLSLMNAMIVAEKLDFDFKFAWPAMRADGGMHAVASVQDIFSPEFISRYYEPHFDLNKFVPVNKIPVTQDLIDNLSAEGLSGVDLQTCDEAVSILGEEPSAAQYAKTWRKIDFSERLKHVIAKADAVAQSNDVAIHVRRGDTVSGVYRLRLFNYKYLPISFVKTIIEDQTNHGKRIILFSDDQRILKIMSEKYKIKTTKDFGVDEFKSNLEKALFDIAIMSKAQKIIATHSVFSILSGMIGKKKIQNPVEIFKNAIFRKVINDDILNNSQDYMDLDIAKEYQWIVNEASYGLDFDEKEDLWNKSIKLDPHNYTYFHQLGLESIRNKKYQLANDYLKESIERYFKDTGGVGPEIMHIFNILTEKRSRAFSAPGSTGEHPYIIAFHADALQKTKGAASALATAKQAHMLAPESDALLAFYVQTAIDAGERDEALEALFERFKRGEAAAILYRQASEILEQKDQKALALDYAAKALLAAPNALAYIVRMAWIEAKCGELEAASQRAAQVDISMIQDAATMFQYSRLMRRLGGLKEAIAAAEVSVSMRPKKVHYQNWLQGLRLSAVEQ